MAAGSEKRSRKRWYMIVASEQFQKALIGEVPCFNGEQLVGKSFWVNLAHLSGDSRDHSIRLRFQVTHVTGERADTALLGYALSPANIKRMVRPGRDRIDDSFQVVTQDKVGMRVKMLYLTRNKVKRGISREILHKGREEIAAFFGKVMYEDAFGEIIANRFQKGLKSVLGKIYPLSNVDVKNLERVK